MSRRRDTRFELEICGFVSLRKAASFTDHGLRISNRARRRPGGTVFSSGPSQPRTARARRRIQCHSSARVSVPVHTRFWKKPPEPNYTATDFTIKSGGTSQWPLPAADFPVNQKYWNPNGNHGAVAIWDWNYNVQRLSERPSYWKVAERYKRATAISATQTETTNH